jgi:hypothetical protein
MIVRNDVTADTYCPLPFSNADYRLLKKDFRVHAPHLTLDLGHTERVEYATERFPHRKLRAAKQGVAGDDNVDLEARGSA